MKSLSTSALTQKYLTKVKSSNCYTFTKATYVDDNSVEQDFTIDLLYPISIKKMGRAPRYANINYDPAAAECEFSVLNKEGIYSPKNTSSSLRDVFKRDRVVKFYEGKWISDSPSTESTAIDFETATIQHYYTTLGGSDAYIQNDISNSEGEEVKHFTDLFDPLYDSETYDDSTYTPDGVAVITKDLGFTAREIISSLDIACDATGVSVYYRIDYNTDYFSETTTISDWTYAGELENGTVSLSLNGGQGGRALQIAFLFNSGDWFNSPQISSVSVNYTTYVEWVLLGSFYLDDPKFKDAKSPKISTIKINGRNAWKRALDYKINLEDLSSGVTLHQLIKDVCDVSGISYTASSIADLSSFGNRTLSGGYKDQVTPAQIFQNILQIIGKTYRMSIDDENVLYVSLRPTNYDVNFVFSFKNYVEAEQKEQSDRQILRLTMQTDNQVLDASALLDSDTFVASGDQTLSWSGGAVAKYYTYTLNSGDLAISSVEYNNESAVFTLIGSGSITISIYGSKFQSTEPDYYGEAVNSTNIENNIGSAFREINPLLISDAEAKSIAKNFVDEFGDPEYNVKIKDAYLNGLIDLNDQVLIVSENFLETQLYEVLSIEHEIDSEVSKITKFELIDTGRDITDQGDLIWDRALFGTGANLTWDSGIIWDANYPIGTTADTIRAANNRFVDVDFI